MHHDEAAELSQIFARIQETRDEGACSALWDAVYGRLLTIVRSRLAVQHRRAADEEDLALSAIHSFVHAAEAGRLKSVQGRDDLWRVLITIMLRKMGALTERETAEKRGSGDVRGDSVFESRNASQCGGFDHVPDPRDPSRFVDELLGECRERMQSLPDSTLQKIALRRMEGFEVTEIAAELGVAVATIKRKLARIRQMWCDETLV